MCNSYSFSVSLCFSTSFLYAFFFFNDTATPEIYTLSLHDALPISVGADIAFDADPKFFACLVRFESSSVPTTQSEPNRQRSEERFSRNAETDLVCRLLLEKKKKKISNRLIANHNNLITIRTVL